MTRSLLIAGCIVVAFAACGNTPKECDPDALMQKAQICPDRTALGFDMEYGSATWIGVTKTDTFILRNGGVEDLTIQSVGTSGDSAFKFRASWDTDTTDAVIPGDVKVRGNKSVAIQIEFTPTQARLYQASLTVESNAQNDGTLILKVSGCGVPTDGGVSSCYRDGGLAP